jgi:hypothetical protein
MDILSFLWSIGVAFFFTFILQQILHGPVQGVLQYIDAAKTDQGAIVAVSFTILAAEYFLFYHGGDIPLFSNGALRLRNGLSNSR